MMATAGVFSASAATVNYTLNPAAGAATNLVNVEVSFPDNMVYFYENNRMPVAILENTSTGMIYECQEANRDTRTTAASAYNLTFIAEDATDVEAITAPGNYELTIRSMYITEGEEMVDVDPIKANYTITYPVKYALNPEAGKATDLSSITLEFTENGNVEFFENNRMPAVTLENLTTGEIYICQEPTRDTRAMTSGILYQINFTDEDGEDAAIVTLPGDYLLTVKGLALNNDGELQDLPPIIARYTIDYPVEYVLTPSDYEVTNLSTVMIDFPNNTNVGFDENPRMASAVLENLTNGKIYYCQEPTRNTFAQTNGRAYDLTFIEEDSEEAAEISEPGTYLLTIRNLSMEVDGESTVLPVITKGYMISYPYEYDLTPAAGSEVRDLSSVTLTFATAKVGFPDNNRMPVATMVNNDTDETFNCYEAERNTFAETEGSSWVFVFLNEEDEPATIKATGHYTLTIQGMYTEEIVDGEVTDMTFLPAIYADYTIGFPVDFILNPTDGSNVNNLQTIVLEFPDTKNVMFYENNRMPVATLVNISNNVSYVCETPDRNPRAESEGIVYNLNFVEEGTEEVAPIAEDGVYVLTVQALAYVDDEQAVISDLPVITATYYIASSGVKAAQLLPEEETYTVYTLSGLRVITNGNASSLNGLGNGVYIINGKKVIIRK